MGTRKLKFAFIFFLLFSSCNQTENWSVDHLFSSTNCISRLCFHTPNPINGIDLEFMQTKTNIYAFLQIRSQKVFPKEVKIIADSNIYQFSLRSCDGNHRFTLEEKEKKSFLHLLQTANEITLQIGPCFQKIKGDEIKKWFQKMKRPWYQIPFN
ncbi:MAG: hypothetical protein L0207_05930 [Chlamydiae bacterium]|nr:hypothetical protein [Chlamydiota bacterium]